MCVWGVGMNPTKQPLRERFLHCQDWDLFSFSDMLIISISFFSVNFFGFSLFFSWPLFPLWGHGEGAGTHLG